jgi:hypothetical protein
MRKSGRSWRRVASSGLCGPAASLAVFALLLYDLLETKTVGVGRGAYGPLSWPKFALTVLVAGAVLLCLLKARELLARKGAHAPAGPREEMADGRVALVAILIALYAAGFVYVGYLFSTFVFLTAWLAMTGYRRPAMSGLVGVLGAVLPLYLLIKVAYMPLPRGVGVIEQATIHIYQWLHLF